MPLCLIACSIPYCFTGRAPLNDADANTNMTLNNTSMGSQTSVGGGGQDDINGAGRGSALHGRVPGNGLGKT